MAAQRGRDSEMNEGASGGFGKFRKRSFRKPAATPYARPPSAAVGASSGGGWISKLVDPAQKLLTSGAQRFFASVFQKRLTNTSPKPSYEPTTVPDSVSNTREEINVGKAIATPSTDSHALKLAISETPNSGLKKDSISELEEALGQHTFSRSEVERLTSLLQSKIVDQPFIEAKTNLETSQITLPFLKSDGASIIPAGGPYQGNVAASVSNTAELNGLLDDVASPTELAKAFMDGRSSYAFPSKISSFKPSLLKDQSNALTNATLSPKLQSIAHYPSSTDQAGFQLNDFTTPRSIGRSALYGMVRTPYSRSIWSNNLQGSRSPLSSLGGGSTLFHDSGKMSRSIESKPESLKRRSSVLENDVNSGNIRRIRQKSNLLPNSGILSSGSSRLPIESSQPTSKKGKSVVSFEALPESANDNVHALKFNTVPSKSSEMASKILQQLDTLVSSREKSPTKLSQSMLRGPALRSLENVDPPKFLLDHNHDDRASHQEISLPVSKAKLADDNRKKDVVNKATVSLNKPVVQDDVPSSSKNTANGLDKPLSMGEAPATPVTRKAFQMSAHEDYIESDDNDYPNVSVEKVEEKNVRNNVTDSICSNQSYLIESKENVENKNIVPGPFSGPVSPFATADKETPLVFNNLSQSKTLSTFQTSVAPEAYDTKPFSSTHDYTTSTEIILPTDSIKEPIAKALPNVGFQADTLNVTEIASASSTFVTSSIFSFGVSASNSSPSNGSLGSNSIFFSSTSTASTLGSTTSSPAASFFKFGSPVPQSALSVEAPLTASEPAVTKINGFEFGGTSSGAPVSEISTSVALASSSSAPFSVVAPPTFGGASTAATSTSGVFGSSLSSSTPPIIFGATSALSAPAEPSKISSLPSATIFGAPSADLSSFSCSPSTVSFGASGGFSSNSSLSSAPVFGASSTATSFSNIPFPAFNATSAATTTSSLFQSSSSAANSSTGNSIFNFNSGTTSLTSNQFPFHSFSSSTQSSSSSSTGAPFQFGSSVSPTSFGSMPFSSSASVSTSVYNSTWQPPNSSSSQAAAFSFGSSSGSKATPFSFGSPIPTQQFGSSEQNMEDNMAEDTVHDATSAPVFNQQAISSGFPFGSTNANQVGAQSPFQFGGQASPSPFQATGSVDFQGSGSFSLGASGGEKATRRIVKVRKTMRKR